MFRQRLLFSFFVRMPCLFIDDAVRAELVSVESEPNAKELYYGLRGKLH